MKAYCVLDDYNKTAVDAFLKAGIEIDFPCGVGRPDEERLIELVADYDVLIIGAREKMTQKVYRAASKVKFICSLSIGLDHFCQEFFDDKEYTIFNSTDSNVVSVAEHTLALILSLLKELKSGDICSLNGTGRKGLSTYPSDLLGKTIGVIGAGRIASETIKKLACFGVKLRCSTKTPSAHSELLKYGVEFCDLNLLLSESDIVTLHLPLNTDTRALLGREQFALLKNDAVLINTSRFRLFDENALIDYLKQSPNIAIGLDIDIEEAEIIKPFLPRNAIVTPHIAGISNEAIARMDLELANKLINTVAERKK